MQMKFEVEKLENGKEKQPYETPKLTKHGSVQEVTGGIIPSGCDPKTGIGCGG